MAALRSLLVTLIWLASCLVICILLSWTLLGPPSWSRPVSRLIVRWTFWLLRVGLGITYEIRGTLPDRPVLVAAKHQSAWETFGFCLFFENPCYVLKQELTWIPLFGWYLKKQRMVAIDRAGGAKALRSLLAHARERLAEGRPLIIFPEGTRVPPGETRSYHPGVAALYQSLEIPCVPVALNSGLVWPKPLLGKRPGRIVLEVLPEIPPGLDRKAFVARLSGEIEAASTDLLAEGRAAQGR
ncbi:lysophospholipid acyltransferase family protein [Algihabitans albus]|uniref:lysophospholipid acyltransferase family protein n=1 Tax=Algihabitans albus TaxID=2164067 RepID=UPI000E5DA04B|nr:lysophospholipid acyltransferase family protein [Algihabitans albus]